MSLMATAMKNLKLTKKKFKTPMPRTSALTKKFHVGPLIGTGRFGKVYLCALKDSEVICAVKVISLYSVHWEQTIPLITREIEIQSKANHKNILRLFSFFYDDLNIYLVLEYAYFGSVLESQRFTSFSEAEVAAILVQVCAGVEYLHRNRIVHRDLKSENILIDVFGNVKIADFSWAAKINSHRNSFCGSEEYCSPEMLGRESHDFSSDKWSLGCIAFELLTKKSPTLIRERVSSYCKRATIPYYSPRSASLLSRGNPGVGQSSLLFYPSEENRLAFSAGELFLPEQTQSMAMETVIKKEKGTVPEVEGTDTMTAVSRSDSVLETELERKLSIENLDSHRPEKGFLKHLFQAPELVEVGASLSKEAFQFLEACLVIDPTKRWKISELLHSPLLCKYQKIS